MKDVEERIKKTGLIFDNDVLVVAHFLNHNVDIKLLKKMANEVKKHFDTKIDRILTVEASGIPFATAIAMEYGCDMLFAKKTKTSNLPDNVLSTKIFSYTHKEESNLVIAKNYVNEGERVLIVDDFMATGNASLALLELAKKAKLDVVGFSVCVEKEYQGGGNKIRKLGYDCYSLASIKKMANGEIEFN